MVANSRRLAFNRKPTGNSFQFCHEIRGSATGLKSHTSVHSGQCQ